MRFFKTIITIATICLFVLLGCNKEDELGEVIVKIKLIDENEYEMENKSGINVVLTRGQEKYSSTTNSLGESYFDNLPYGIFNVELEKEGYISDLCTPSIEYHDNDSIDFFRFNMLEIPKYSVKIDSIIRKRDMDYDSRLYAYGKLQNKKGIPKVQYRLITYFGDKENVSKDNFQFYHYTAILGWKIEGNNCELMITNWVNSFIVPPEADTLYVRFYPCASYFDWIPIREQAFGTPSDVFKWIVPN